MSFMHATVHTYFIPQNASISKLKQLYFEIYSELLSPSPYLGQLN